MRKPVLQLLAPALSLLVAGCGAVSSATSSTPGALAVTAAKSAIDTTNTDQLSARFFSGETASVKWSIASGENDPSLGEGSISAAGVYSPPALLSRDRIQVKITATTPTGLASSSTITVTPGFAQVLTPETATLPPGGTVQVSGVLAEINGGSVRWSLSSTPAEGEPADAYGSLSEAKCNHSSRTYTTCSVTYTAPRALPAGSPSLFVVGAAGGNRRSAASLHVLLNGGGFASSGLENQAAQAGYVEMGTSGGNANDYDSRKVNGSEYVNDCCGGTLGALVTDHSSNLYILSNNHVLAESDQARAGDTIVQPALVDLNCNPQAGRTVGSLRSVVPLESKQTNVDAAMAAATPAVDGTGAILELGPAVNGSLTPGAPAGGTGETLTADLLGQLRVVKSGRTTGLTCSTVNTVNLSVQVDYYYDCAETKPYYTKTFVNQIGMPGGSFADSGDSGALVLDAANAQPVGLFFASGADDSGHGFSVANPIQDVLNELGDASHTDGLEIAGGGQHPITCPRYDEHMQPSATPLSAFARAEAKVAVEQAANVLARPEVLGLAPGQSLDNPGEAAVIVYVDRNKSAGAVPQTIHGVRTLVIPTDTAAMGVGTQPSTLAEAEGIRLPADVLKAAAAVQRTSASRLMADPAFFGVGVTQSFDNPSEAALLVLVDLQRTPQSMPATVGGLRVRYVRVNRLHVTRSKYAPANQAPRCGVPVK